MKPVLAIVAVFSLSACTPGAKQTTGELIFFSTVAGGIACGLAKVC